MAAARSVSFALAAAWLGVFSVAALPASAQGANMQPDSFYKGKTLTLYVGFVPGGGYDATARLVAKYIGKYISGDPTVIVKNMPGAGGITMANYVAAVAPKEFELHINLNLGKANAVMYACDLTEEYVDFNKGDVGDPTSLGG